MSYTDEARQNILKEGATKSIEFAKEKAESYKQAGKMNYAMYKAAKSADEARSRYAASQSAYEKSAAWQEVVSILIDKLGR